MEEVVSGRAVPRAPRPGWPWAALISVSLLTAIVPRVDAQTIGAITMNASTVGTYEKFEVTFDVTTSAPNPYLPYDPDPPAGLQPGSGVTVSAEFSADNWETSFSVPAFYYQEYLVETRGDRDWLYPTDTHVWKARFSPPTAGTWQFRITVEDRDGLAESPTASFTVRPSGGRGFLRVSPTDARYFEFEDGTYFPGLGHSIQYVLNWIDPRQGNEPLFAALESNGMDYARMWLTQMGIHGAFGPWESAAATVFPASGRTYGDSEIALPLIAGVNPCVFVGWQFPSPAVKRGVNYRVRVRFFDRGLADPRVASEPYGLVAKVGPWLWDGGRNHCASPGSGSRIAATFDGDTRPDPVDGAWQILEGTWFSGNRDFLPLFYLAIENAGTGGVSIDHVWIEEDLGNGQYGPNIIYKPSMAHHMYFDQRNSLAFDHILELAEQHDVYLRPTINADTWIWEHLGPDGAIEYPGGVDNYYGDRTETKVRWLQQAWWRYVQARWGYSTHIHSWELMNEGDPFNARHFMLADEFGRYMHQFTPNDHLVSTSTWHSFDQNLWNSPDFPNIDFADEHNYIFRDEPEFRDAARAVYELSMLRGARQSGGSGKPVIRGETGFVEAGNTNAAVRDLNQDTGGVWFHNYVWAQINAGGMMDAGYWYPEPHIYCLRANPTVCPNRYDHRAAFRAYRNFIEGVPLSNGHYVDAAAVTSNRFRAWGQKDPANGRAHLWIQNPDHTWFNVVRGNTIETLSGAVTIAGFRPESVYTIEWWDTYETDLENQPRTVQAVPSNAAGEITLTIMDLGTDVAVRISGPGADLSGGP